MLLGSLLGEYAKKEQKMATDGYGWLRMDMDGYGQ